MRSRVCVCVRTCIKNTPWLRQHRGEGSGHEAALTGTRACPMILWESHVRMRKNNTKRQSPVDVAYWGVPNCPLLSAAPSALTAPNPALFTPLIPTQTHTRALVRGMHVNTHTHTPTCIHYSYSWVGTWHVQLLKVNRGFFLAQSGEELCMAISRFVLVFLETCVLISDHLYAVYDSCLYLYTKSHLCRLWWWSGWVHGVKSWQLCLISGWYFFLLEEVTCLTVHMTSVHLNDKCIS